MSDETNTCYFLILSLLCLTFCTWLTWRSLSACLKFQWIEAHTFPSRMSKFIGFGASKSIRDNSVNLSCFLKMKLKRQEAWQKLETDMFDMSNILFSLLTVYFIQVWFFSIKKFWRCKQKKYHECDYCSHFNILLSRVFFCAY